VDIYGNRHQDSAIASLIDHTLLKPDASKSDIRQLCLEALTFRFASVCVNPCWLKVAAGELAGSPVKVCTTIGFPLGANESRTKLFEAEIALAEGAHELDMVQNVGALRSGQHDLVRHEIELVAELVHSRGALLKVILETCLLNQDEKKTACRLAADAGADFVKTSTGFASGGALAADVALLRSEVGPSIGVKASGGIRTLEALREMVAAGATRIGSSSGVRIIEEAARERTTTAALINGSSAERGLTEY
jgi:deoxyribose-phosphate aldolase